MTSFIKTLSTILFGGGYETPAWSSRPSRILFDQGLTMSTVFLGRQGVGKTLTLAMELVELIKAHPEQSFFIFDWSGGLTNATLQLILSDSNKDELLPRLIYDDMGGRNINGEMFVLGLPGLAAEYDPELDFFIRIEEQSEREVRTFEALFEDLITKNPTMGGRPIRSLLPNLLALAGAIRDATEGGTWQITEVVRLINPERRKEALALLRGKFGKVHSYFTDVFKGETKIEQDIAQALADVLAITENRTTRARVGWPKPSYTPREVIGENKVVFCDGSGLTNNLTQKDYEYLRLFHLVMAEINKRVPSAPGYAPVNWVMDEVYTFSETPSAGRLLSHLTTEYRNRKLNLFLVVQSVKQLPGEWMGKKGLEDLFWSMGNIVCFSLLDYEDAAIVGQQFFSFDPSVVKAKARRDGQHDMYESRDEQITRWANRIQHLEQRECFVRRFIDEARMDRIQHVGKTRDIRLTASFEDVSHLKDQLMKERGVPLEAALKHINNRQLKTSVLKKEAAKGRQGV